MVNGSMWEISLITERSYTVRYSSASIKLHSGLLSNKMAKHFNLVLLVYHVLLVVAKLSYAAMKFY